MPIIPHHRYTFAKYLWWSILVYVWCPEPESNRHDAKHRGILSPLRLPVPPSGPVAYSGLSTVHKEVTNAFVKRFVLVRLCGWLAMLVF